MTRVNRVALVTGAAALAFNSACYAYLPVSGMPLGEAQKVRVHLTGEGTTELARFLGPRVQNVDGTVAAVRQDGSLNVAVATVQLTDGVRQSWSGEGIVAFPTQYVSSVERSELNKTRTIVGSLALAVGLLGIAIAALKSSGSQGGPGPGGTPQQ